MSARRNPKNCSNAQTQVAHILGRAERQRVAERRTATR